MTRFIIISLLFKALVRAVLIACLVAGTAGADRVLNALTGLMAIAGACAFMPVYIGILFRKACDQGYTPQAEVTVTPVFYLLDLALAGAALYAGLYLPCLLLMIAGIGDNLRAKEFLSRWKLTMAIRQSARRAG